MKISVYEVEFFMFKEDICFLRVAYKVKIRVDKGTGNFLDTSFRPAPHPPKIFNYI